MSHKTISPVDARLLESLELKYSPEELLRAVSRISADSNIDEPEEVTNEEESSDPTFQEIVLNFIKQLEGHRVRIREFHWSAEYMSAHTLTDSLMNSLINLEDNVAEDMQGLLGIRIKVGSIVPTLPKYTDLTSGIKGILQDILTFRASVGDFPACQGIISILDDFIHDLNKYSYLETFK